MTRTEIENTIFMVKNRSASMVVYSIPEENIRREFAPGETKRIKFSELEKLTYQSGGRQILSNFLQISDDKALTNLNIKTEPEYFMSEQQIINLLRAGSQNEFLDALDFAPQGVIDLIKQFSVKLPLTDIRKIEALKNKTGFDLTTALANIAKEKEDDEAEANAEPAPERRVKPAEVSGGRRSAPNYKEESASEETKTTTKTSYKRVVKTEEE